MKTPLSIALTVLLAPLSAIAAADDDTDSTVVKSQKVEVTVNQATTQNVDDAGPKTRVSGRIVIEGPDGQRQEYKLGEKLPEGWKLDLGSLSGLDGLSVDGQIVADTEPRLMIGVVCKAASEALRSHLKLGEHGLLVTQVSRGLPAARAGIQRNDILLSVGDQKLTHLKDLVDIVSGSDGRELEILALHAGEEVTLKVTPEKLTNQDALKALGVSAADSDSEDLEAQVFQFPPSSHHWRMAPVIRLEGDEDIDVLKIIRDVRTQALRDLETEAKSDRATESDLRQQIEQLQKQLAEFQEKLQSAEDK